MGNAAGKGPWPTVVFLHGHQEGLRGGGRDFVSWGVLDRWAERGYLAVAVSQPGYGRSSGPPDFCGPLSQRAVSSVIERLIASGDGVRGSVVIEGISRGAVVAGLLAQADASIAGVVWISGLFDLPQFAAEANTLSGKRIRAAMRSETGRVTDQGVREISGLRRLEVLWLCQCGITGESVDLIAPFTSLRELAVRKTRITTAGKERLRQLLPECRVVEDGVSE